MTAYVFGIPVMFTKDECKMSVSYDFIIRIL